MLDRHDPVVLLSQSRRGEHFAIFLSRGFVGHRRGLSSTISTIISATSGTVVDVRYKFKLNCNLQHIGPRFISVRAIQFISVQLE